MGVLISKKPAFSGVPILSSCRGGSGTDTATDFNAGQGDTKGASPKAREDKELSAERGPGLLLAGSAFPLLLALLFTQRRGETVWKIAEGLSSVLRRRQKAADRGSFDPYRPPSGPIFRRHPDFPNSSPRA